MVSKVAVIGGGISGTFCAWILRSKGLSPTIYDLGNRSVGGRFGTKGPDYGAQFIRSSDNAHYNSILAVLQEQGLIAPWKGRFGVLGSKGGYLPKSIITTSTAGKNRTTDKPSGPDDGDFCGFMSGQNFFVGVPNMSAVCSTICSNNNISLRGGLRVDDVVYNPNTSQWSVHASPAGTTNNSQSAESTDDSGYDAVIVATHDPSLAAKIVKAHCTSKNLSFIPDLGQNGKSDVPDSASDLSLNKRAGSSPDQELDQITIRFSEALQNIRDNHKAPVFTLTCEFKSDLSAVVPFDAVTCPTSLHIQFIARDSSKPFRGKSNGQSEKEVWTAVSTSSFAQELLLLDAKTAALHMQKQLMTLLEQYGVEEPVSAVVQRWGAGFHSKTLGLKEDCVSFEQWRIAVCGDFIGEHPTPIQAAILSGVEAGERVSTWFDVAK